MKRSSLLSCAIFGLFSLSWLSGCSFTLVEDEELPPGDTSHIVLIRSNPSAQVESVSVDRMAVPMFANSLSVPAGPHEIALQYSMEAGPGCDTIDDLCATTTLRGECSGTVRTLPGRAYLLNLETRFGEVTAQVNPKGFFDLLSREDEPNVGSLTCNIPLRNDGLRRRL
jgi:hypothetical protein